MGAARMDGPASAWADILPRNVGGRCPTSDPHGVQFGWANPAERYNGGRQWVRQPPWVIPWRDVCERFILGVIGLIVLEIVLIVFR